MPLAARGKICIGMLLSASMLAAPRAGYVWGADSPATATAPSQDDKPATQPVKRGSLSLEIKADGIFQATDCFELRPVLKAYAGKLEIQSIAPHGKKVHKGDLLLSVDSQGIRWAITAAESDLMAAKAALDKAEADQEVGRKMDALALRNQEDAVRNAEMGKQWWDTVDGPHMLEANNMQVKQAQAAVDDENDELDQLRKMYKDDNLTNATSEIVVKRAVRQLDQSKESLKMQQQRQEKVKTFDYPISKQRVVDGIEGARQQLELLKSSLTQTAVARHVAVTTAKLGLEQATKRAADLKDDLANFTVKAPCDGLIEYGGDPTALESGEHIMSGQLILRVLTPGKLKVVVPLPESQAFWVHPGNSARITPTACPQMACRATCGPVDVTSRGNPSVLGFQVSLDPGETDIRLLPGMKTAVTIDCGHLDDVLLVPVAAITDGKVKIVRKKDGKIVNRQVEVGRSDGQSVEIKSGLKEGDEVVLPGKK